MANTITKAELLEKIRAGRERWEEDLAKVPEERLTEPGVEGDWSVKDVIAHVTYWERAIVERLEAALHGEEPPRIEVDDLDTDAANALIYRKNQDRPLHVVRDESRQVYQRLVAAVEALSEDELNHPQRYAWTEGDALWEQIPGDSYKHYEDHIAPLRAWLNRRSVHAG